MDRKPRTVDIRDFVANWPAIIQEIDSGDTTGVDVMRDGHVIALVRSPDRSLHGYLRGTVHIPESFDLTSPAFADETHAERGRIHE